MFNWVLGVNAIGRKPSFEQRANFVDQGTINSSKLKASTRNRTSPTIRVGIVAMVMVAFQRASNNFYAS